MEYAQHPKLYKLYFVHEVAGTGGSGKDDSTARFAQPIGTLILYPMLALSGLFMPIDSLPPRLQVIARTLPFSSAVSLLRGIWRGEGWSGHLGDVLVLTLMFLVCTAASARVFRWE